MTSKHTPGPWVYNRTLVEVRYDDGGEYPFTVCTMPCWTDEYKCERNANARLIAAAPDLLAALEAAVECGMVPVSSASEGGANRYSDQVRVADAIRAAIAKARGE